ncbi:MAG TPA: hypothetical protein VFG38_15755 [Pseudomonadales bacterium]|nr:hypothetical protein [Pseudomonadales bacterium]
MVLVDASVWVEHFRRNDAQLARLLEAADVVVHLLASAVIARARLWTRDERLAAVARELAVA